MTLRDTLRDRYRPLPNILIVGSQHASAAALQKVCPLFRGASETCMLPGPLRLPSAGRAALILHNVGALNAEQQEELSNWLESGTRVPVVSVSDSSLFALVANGTFNEELYYRLNMILEDADRAPGTASWLVNGAPLPTDPSERPS
jgi:hypothetical protein